METISRPLVVALLTTATGSTAAGLWLHAAGGRAAPAGFLQYAAVAAGSAVLGSFVLWHRPGNRYGLAHAVIGVLFGTVVLAAGVLSGADTPSATPGWAADVALAWSWAAAAALLPLWVFVIAAFPDGRFHREMVKRATLALTIVLPFLAVVAYLLAPPGEPPPLIGVEPPSDLAGPLAPPGDPHPLHRLASVAASALGTLAPLAAVAALVDRFLKAGPVLRQQIKWLLAGVTISVGLQALAVPSIDAQGLRTLAQALVLLAVPLPMLAAGIAIFKYGLWEIDVVISKGLVYASVSGALTALFLGVSLVAGVSVGGQDARAVAALGLALVVSFLAQPLRQRLERVAARLLFGDEPRGLSALTGLSDAGAPALHPQELGARVAGAARDALGTPWAVACLHTPGEESGLLRTLAVSGAEPGPPALLTAPVATALAGLPGGVPFADLTTEVAEALRPAFADEPAVVAPLTSGGRLAGLLACGARPRDPFGEEDLELLAVVARESALALRNIRLEEELRRRLEQIEHQAAELHSSRQRLVTGQDQERRRLERDLHDGAQQQLVALAARLRQAARADGPSLQHCLEDLADEAEEAVFALQELARGIYPSLLADRGLQAALQAHAARLPAPVRVEMEPCIRGRRLEPDLEAALYFVGLEAMTNAVKHAPSSRVTVPLRAEPSRRTVTLEVHDDGPGFDPDSLSPRSTGGLQNMADRIDALGGVLSVKSAPGGGTWVRAEVEERTQVSDIRSRAATP